MNFDPELMVKISRKAAEISEAYLEANRAMLKASSALEELHGMLPAEMAILLPEYPKPDDMLKLCQSKTRLFHKIGEIEDPAEKILQNPIIDQARVSEDSRLSFEPVRAVEIPVIELLESSQEQKNSVESSAFERSQPSQEGNRLVKKPAFKKSSLNNLLPVETKFYQEIIFPVKTKVAEERKKPSTEIKTWQPITFRPKIQELGTIYTLKVAAHEHVRKRTSETTNDKKNPMKKPKQIPEFTLQQNCLLDQFGKYYKLRTSDPKVTDYEIAEEITSFGENVVSMDPGLVQRMIQRYKIAKNPVLLQALWRWIDREAERNGDERVDFKSLIYL
ncbi:hypothetical protein G9A89_009876 [Geosiphon pyriformis]|nr:hypothetical protein G9A89_009876 [Geosiphon pyriformis]